MAKQEQRKIAFQTKWYNELKLYSEYSGVPMATLLTRLWQNSKERKAFIRTRQYVMCKDCKEMYSCEKTYLGGCADGKKWEAYQNE